MRRVARILLRSLAVLTVAAVACATAPAGGRSPVPVAAGVSVAGVPVGGLTWQPARERLQQAFEKPLRFEFGRESWRVAPERLGASAAVDATLDDAIRARAGAAVALRLSFSATDVRRYVEGVARRLHEPARDARLAGVVDLRPAFTVPAAGREVRRAVLAKAIERALRTGNRAPIRVRVRSIAPRVTADNFGAVVVIRRGSNELYLYDGPTLVRSFRVATGTARYPTPLGTFSIVDMQRDPWWRPPDSDWAKGLKPVPPGPGNPLGTRWMGITAPGVGIHGTPDAASIGYSASHGCIRMQIPEAEWLFGHVAIGTPVVIVPY